MEGKVEALGYGFLVPIFFIYTGVTYDLEALFADPCDARPAGRSAS